MTSLVVSFGDSVVASWISGQATFVRAGAVTSETSQWRGRRDVHEPVPAIMSTPSRADSRSAGRPLDVAIDEEYAWACHGGGGQEGRHGKHVDETVARGNVISLDKQGRVSGHNRS